MIRLLLLAILALTGCGSVPPAPADHFYRLQPVALPAFAKALPVGVAVQPLRADSLYAERPLVYGETGQPRVLRQYHYHLWLYPPAQLVQDHLAASLNISTAASRAARIDGRVVRFDRVMTADGSRAAVALELRLVDRERTVIGRVYRAEQAATDTSVAAHVVAVEQALAAIYAEFLGEIAAVRPGGSQ